MEMSLGGFAKLNLSNVSTEHPLIIWAPSNQTRCGAVRWLNQNMASNEVIVTSIYMRRYEEGSRSNLRVKRHCHLT